MSGAVGGERDDMPVLGGLSAAMAAQPTGDHQARVLSIDVEGDTACVTLAESGFWGQDSIDFFLLSRIEGDWQIVARSFTHGGAST